MTGLVRSCKLFDTMNLLFLYFTITACIIYFGICQSQVNGETERSFRIDYHNDQFLMDGEPFRYISGSMHYFRVPPEYWKNRFLKMKAAGLNAVQTYIEWSQHEPQPGVYNFKDMLDVISFIKLAQKTGLYVILRPGPYICAERDMGGLPFWLLRENPNITLRTMDPTYIQHVDKWMAKLLPMIKPLLYANGGPIIMVQVENEYGSYYACDWDYMNHLRDVFRHYLGKKAVLFTTDGNDDSFLICGKIQGVYATVDFGPGSNVTESFHAQRNHEPRGPLVNSEYYTGRLGHWGHAPPNLNLSEVIQTLEEMLDMNASVNMYMFHGGTSFGFTNGANADDTYVPDTTSYDFSGPLAESGSVTLQYLTIRKCLKKYVIEPLPPIPDPTPMAAYGKVAMKSAGSLFELLPLLSKGPPVTSEDPLTFEAMGQAYGFMLYRTVLNKTFMDPSLLDVPGIRDRGYVFLNTTFVGIVSRTGKINQLPITAYKGQELNILVENQGRINYGKELKDFKGLISAPSLGNIVLKNWTMFPLPFNNSKMLYKAIGITHMNSRRALTYSDVNGIGVPRLYTGQVILPVNETDDILDTFLTTPGWSKGIAYINEHLLGRYWPSMGPQLTLFVPKRFLRPSPERNLIILLELQNSPCSSDSSSFRRKSQNCYVEFVDHEILNGTTPKYYTSERLGHGIWRKIV